MKVKFRNNKCWQNNYLKIGFSFGVISFILYLCYSILGHILWNGYNPVTMDISSLSAVGAPNQEIIAPINFYYHISMIIFLISLSLYSFLWIKNNLIKIGALLLFLMELISLIGYKMFPLEGDKTIMTFQNSMHIAVTIVVVFSSIFALYFLSAGYSKLKNSKIVENLMYILSTMFLVFGLLNPISINLNLNILGLTERLAIYSLHLYISLIAIYNVSLVNKFDKGIK